MRKIINSTYTSLDGVIENPRDWPAGPPDDVIGQVSALKQQPGQDIVQYGFGSVVLSYRTTQA